eukprot:CAMPEP_0170488334 /NCGR_PEP_ID=MMETSP0208-20121228/6916_1 /TAXON_ID=197538 /ORGANISM="Strombidium inclinatum, Strain S3" /LENGTH=166 /DNA_ID=CAMNT_0010762877 /DNA_START=265 /DNA_END=765 /DNA_ORIENTATION=+
MRINNQHVIQLQIWDTAGQESFRSITRIFYKGSHAVVLVYDITSAESFEAVREWKKEIENNADRHVLVYLVGNRADLEEEREVEASEGVSMMQELELDNHLESSALTGQNIGNLFETLTKHLYMENNNKLGEFREDGATMNDNNRAESLGMNKKNNIDLYAPKPKK